MIPLTLPRQYVETLQSHFLPDIALYKNTRLQNVSNLSVISEAYLAAVVINCVLSEIEHLIKKKLINTTGRNIKFELTDAQGVVLYKTLILLPINAGNIYLDMVRNQILQLLDAQLIRLNLAQTAKNCASTA